MQLIILSGLSGSGKSIALHTLEDMGFYCIDNLPFFLLQDLVLGLRETLDAAFGKTAVGIDARGNPEALRQLPELARAAQERGTDCRVLFLETQLETLIRRYSETRRRHPLTNADRSLREAIQLEQEFLEPVRKRADLVIDTTQTNVHELRDRVRAGCWAVSHPGSRSCSNPLVSSMACRPTSISCSMCAVCPTRTGRPNCACSLGSIRRSPASSNPVPRR
jgi:RNase adapter protein RapZ